MSEIPMFLMLACILWPLGPPLPSPQRYMIDKHTIWNMAPQDKRWNTFHSVFGWCALGFMWIESKDKTKTNMELLKRHIYIICLWNLIFCFLPLNRMFHTNKTFYYSYISIQWKQILSAVHLIVIQDCQTSIKESMIPYLNMNINNIIWTARRSHHSQGRALIQRC